MIPSLSPAERVLKAGFSTQLRTNGERVHYEKVFYRAIVNRDPFAKSVRVPDFDPRDVSEIRFRIDNLSSDSWDNRSLPVVGKHFVTDDGIDHRIMEVKRLGQFVTCLCRSATTCGNYLRNENGEFLQNEDVSLLKSARCASTRRNLLLNEDGQILMNENGAPLQNG